MHLSTEPDRWLLVECGDLHRVFATWAGGYLDGDSWRLNSGIDTVEVDEDGNFLFHGYNGSIYKCHKDRYGTTGYGSHILRETGLKPLKDYKQYMEEALG